MKLENLLSAMKAADLVTVENDETGEILVDVETVEAVMDCRHWLNAYKGYMVYKITIGTVYNDLIISIREK